MRVTYEQSPWAESHVRSIYPILEGQLIDGEWRPFQKKGRAWVGKYRVFDQRTFQAVYAKAENELFVEFSDLIPPETTDDAEWEIIKDRGRYYLSTAFASTILPTIQPKILIAALAKAGIGLVRVGRDMVGEVEFEKLDTEQLAGAMRRILLIEHLCMTLNDRLYKLVDDYWGEQIKKIESGEMARTALQFELGHKGREPL